MSYLPWNEIYSSCQDVIDTANNNTKWKVKKPTKCMWKWELGSNLSIFQVNSALFMIACISASSNKVKRLDIGMKYMPYILGAFNKSENWRFHYIPVYTISLKPLGGCKCAHFGQYIETIFSLEQILGAYCLFKFPSYLFTLVYPRQQ